MILILFEIMDLLDNDLYLIYPNGNIWSKKFKKYIKHNIGRDGYPVIVIYINKKRKYIKLHRILALKFIPNPENKQFIDHIDRNIKNFNLDNLRWVSRGENKINSNVTGKIPYRHIGKYIRKGKLTFIIQIFRNKKSVFTKSCNCNNYTLEEVVKIRNEKYKELGIEIDDK